MVYIVTGVLSYVTANHLVLETAVTYFERKEYHRVRYCLQIFGVGLLPLTVCASSQAHNRNHTTLSCRINPKQLVLPTYLTASAALDKSDASASSSSFTVNSRRASSPGALLRRKPLRLKRAALAFSALSDTAPEAVYR